MVVDGCMTGPAERMMQVFAYFEGVIVLNTLAHHWSGRFV